jgi:hypothetical protein
LTVVDPEGSPVTNILRVNMKHGPYHNIGDALLDAKLGDKILISPGRYKEAIRINKSVHIIGDGHLSVILSLLRTFFQVHVFAFFLFLICCFVVNLAIERT